MLSKCGRSWQSNCKPYGTVLFFNDMVRLVRALTRKSGGNAAKHASQSRLHQGFGRGTTRSPGHTGNRGDV
ncbi:hypothetical protein SBA3_180021 [Candidatus Sulfopaludibacter sp. SbA3]|nr:hypothetical protein SBA3_180021 [Candidatus Sulfopaludibacter sp. SbA3]